MDGQPSFIAYKANLVGIKVEWAVPTNTSRACPACGSTAKDNRSGIRFRCRSYGHSGHADAVKRCDDIMRVLVLGGTGFIGSRVERSGTSPPTLLWACGS